MDYGYRRPVELSMEDAIEKVTETLKENGFGVLCDIDVKSTLKEKLDVEVRPYKILGACNPALAPLPPAVSNSPEISAHSRISSIGKYPKLPG